MQGTEGPLTEDGDAPLPALPADVRSLTSYAATATSKACIEPLFDCRDVAELQDYLDRALVSFEHDRAVLPANGTPMADRLRDAIALADNHDALAVGEALQCPPEAPDFQLFVLD